MLSTVSRGFKNISRSMSSTYITKIIFSHSEITKELGFTDSFQKVSFLFNYQGNNVETEEKGKRFIFETVNICRMYTFYENKEGCEGFTYKFKFDSQLKDSDYVFKLKNNESQDSKIVFATNGEEMKLLKGATIDYAEEMMREIFYVKENPNAEISCSCKTSFSPKDYVF